MDPNPAQVDLLGCEMMMDLLRFFPLPNSEVGPVLPFVSSEVGNCEPSHEGDPNE